MQKTLIPEEATSLKDLENVVPEVYKYYMKKDSINYKDTDVFNDSLSLSFFPMFRLRPYSKFNSA